MNKDFGLSPVAQKIAEYACVQYYKAGKDEFSDFSSFGVSDDQIPSICEEFERAGLAYVEEDSEGRPYLCLWEQIAEVVDSPFLRSIRH